MSTPSTEQRMRSLELSPGAKSVLDQIMEITKKEPGELLAEGLALTLLYEKTKEQGGRLMRERNGKLEEIIIPS